MHTYIYRHSSGNFKRLRKIKSYRGVLYNNKLWEIITMFSIPVSMSLFPQKQIRVSEKIFYFNLSCTNQNILIEDIEITRQLKPAASCSLSGMSQTLLSPSVLVFRNIECLIAQTIIMSNIVFRKLRFICKQSDK